MNHFYEGLIGGFWFKSAYDELLTRLSPTVPSVVVEVGSFYGKSAAYLGVEIVNRNLPVTLHCVDNFVGVPSYTRTRGLPTLQPSDLRVVFESNMKPIANALGDRFIVHAATSEAASKEVPDASCVVVWIDAGHSYEDCKQDIELWWPKVMTGGFIGGDDFEIKGVNQAVKETGPYRVGEGWMTDVRYNRTWPWWWREKNA